MHLRLGNTKTFVGMGLVGFLLLGMMLQSFAVADLHPETKVTLVGNYNKVSGWYYGKAILATFSATDEFSEVEEIVVNYNGFDKRCSNGKCILEPGDSLKLNPRDKYGNVTLRYFAIDEEGSIETPQTLSIRVDTETPELYVLKIKTENMNNVSTGKLCNSLKKTINCLMINAKVKETVTFDLLGSDRISGLKDIYYRIITKSNYNGAWHPVEQSVESAHTQNCHFEKTGIYRMQFKSIDIAGNESAVKEFLINVS